MQVKYDTFVTVYMSDCDFYPRVRAAGFETLNYPQVWATLHGLFQQPMLVTLSTVQQPMPCMLSGWSQTETHLLSMALPADGNS